MFSNFYPVLHQANPKLKAHGHGHALFGEQVVIHAPSRKEKIPEWKDWHDYNLIEAESKRTGPGEQGQAVQLTEHEREDAAYKGNKSEPNAIQNKNEQIKRMDSIFLFLIESVWIVLFVIFVIQIVKQENILEYFRLPPLLYHFIMRECQHFYERFIQ